MTYFFYICLSLTLIILQTTIMPYFSIFDRFYDILIPFIFYLGLYRPARESIPVILLLGYVLDNLSGGPFGIFLTTYFWFFIGIRWSIKFFHAGNKVLWLMAVVAGVLIENFIIIATITWLGEPSRLPRAVLSVVGTQLLWALCTGPVLVFVLAYMHRRWDNLLNEIMAAWKQQVV
ncbi:hypothetical protein ACFL0M_08615 [Thermodesulfobacteriota bacterium]